MGNVVGGEQSRNLGSRGAERSSSKTAAGRRYIFGMSAADSCRLISANHWMSFTKRVVDQFQFHDNHFDRFHGYFVAASVCFFFRSAISSAKSSRTFFRANKSTIHGAKRFTSTSSLPFEGQRRFHAPRSMAFSVATATSSLVIPRM